MLEDLKKILPALGYSLEGLVSSWKHERAFRQELCLIAVLAPLALWLDISAGEKAWLLGSMVFVLIVELLNTAVEALADRISTERHPEIKRAKDAGSAAVFLSILHAAMAWLTVLFF